MAHRLAEPGGASEQKRTRFVRYFSHTQVRGKTAIEYHYDVSNEIYQAWLDPARVTSLNLFSGIPSCPLIMPA